MYNPSSYIIDLRKWLAINLPSILRQNGLIRLIWAMMTPLRNWQTEFIRRKSVNDLLARYDTSHGNVRRLLNRMYDSDRHRIQVQEIEPEQQFFDVYVTDDIDDYSAIVGINDNRNYIDAEISSVLLKIKIPRQLRSQYDEINNIVSGYVLPGVKYVIEIIL